LSGALCERHQSDISDNYMFYIKFCCFVLSLNHTY